MSTIVYDKGLRPIFFLIKWVKWVWRVWNFYFLNIDLLWVAFHMPECWIHIGIINSYSNSNNPVSYFHWKIIFFTGIWTRARDHPGTKPICYQLSYPGLDQMCNHKFATRWYTSNRAWWKVQYLVNCLSLFIWENSHRLLLHREDNWLYILLYFHMKQVKSITSHDGWVV